MTRLAEAGADRSGGDGIERLDDIGGHLWSSKRAEGKGEDEEGRPGYRAARAALALRRGRVARALERWQRRGERGCTRVTARASPLGEEGAGRRGAHRSVGERRSNGVFLIFKKD